MIMPGKMKVMRIHR